MEQSRIVAAVTGLLTATALVASPAASVASPPSPARSAALTNLAHLDFLTDTVTPLPQPGHTTYRLDREPAVGVLWVYANHLPTGGYQRTGGGTYDPATNRYGQGSYDADDVSRAAVVYLRHWARSGDRHSRDEAYQLLRGLTYLQTASLVGVRNAAVQAGRQLRVTRPQPIVRRVLDVTGLLGVLTGPVDQPQPLPTRSEYPSGTGPCPRPSQRRPA
jgi:hypothetical protein